MHSRRVVSGLWLVLMLIVSACGAAPAVPTAANPAWLGEQITDVNTGNAFTVADYHGKVVLLEAMAVWCTNCLQQQKNVQALRAQLGQPAGLVDVTLDVDPNETAGSLRDYTAKNDFTWTYAISPAAVSRQLGQLYGDQFLNPTATPMLIVDRQGELHPLPFGIKSAGQLAQSLQPYLNAQ